jgi:hypothetical protein
MCIMKDYYTKFSDNLLDTQFFYIKILMLITCVIPKKICQFFWKYSKPATGGSFDFEKTKVYINKTQESHNTNSNQCWATISTFRIVVLFKLKVIN